jgi:hypothetical protein
MNLESFKQPPLPHTLSPFQQEQQHITHYTLPPSSLQIRILNRSLPRLPIRNLAALLAPPRLLILPKLFHGLLDLRPQIRAVKRRLVDDRPAVLARAVPPHAVHASLGPALLQHDADRVGEAHGVVRRVAGQQEHVAFADDDVAELAVVDDLEQHGAFVLVKPFRSLVDVVVGAGVGAADDLGEKLINELVNGDGEDMRRRGEE